MDCPEFQTLLNQRLDERLDPRCLELQAHAADCADCRQQLQDAVLLLNAVTYWRRGLPSTSPEMMGRIVRHVISDLANSAASQTDAASVKSPAIRSEYSRPAWQSWAMLAGTVAAMWLVFAGSTFRTTNSAQRELAATIKTTPLPAPQVDLEQVMVSATGAYSQVAHESFAAASDFALLWPTSHPANNAPKPAATDSASPSAWPSDPTPIGDTVEDAWKFLQRTVPHVES